MGYIYIYMFKHFAKIGKGAKRVVPVEGPVQGPAKRPRELPRSAGLAPIRGPCARRRRWTAGLLAVWGGLGQAQPSGRILSRSGGRAPDAGCSAAGGRGFGRVDRGWPGWCS